MSTAPMTEAAPGLPYERRTAERRVSPAIGQFAIGDAHRLRHDIERHVAALSAEVTESERLRESNKELLALLAAANCPNCDGSGSWASPRDGIQMQCQWCFERAAIAKAAS